ncbi:MAG: HypC/HybG/HupF family hydrogenase formation chaperone [bacterium]|nr:HypC/HybG/HupF family hydrogenase formation chaperone [bacterium]
MCLGIPGKVIDIEGAMAKVEIGAAHREISLQLLPETKVGNYVIIHAGFAIQLINEEEAKKTLDLLDSISNQMNGGQDEVY